MLPFQGYLSIPKKKKLSCSEAANLAVLLVADCGTLCRLPSCQNGLLSKAKTMLAVKMGREA